MTVEQNIERIKSENDEHFLPASSPWLARYFDDAFQLIDELQVAATYHDFVPACIDGKVLDALIERFRKAVCALPNEYDEERNPPPLEIVVLERALFLLQDFLEMEQARRKTDPAYADECKGANDAKQAYDARWAQPANEGQTNG